MKCEPLFLQPVKYLLLITFFLASLTVRAQKDSLPIHNVTQQRDSLVRDSSGRDSLRIDSVTAHVQVPVKDSIKPFLKHPFSDSVRFLHHKFFSFTDPVRYTVTEREWHGKEQIFYSVIALLIFFALIKNNFRKYFGDLFRTYFRTSIRQLQLREQLMQSPLPSMLFNIFFVLSTSMFLTLAFQHFNPNEQYNFWLLMFYSAAGLSIIYAAKFISLKIIGWILQSPEAANTYIFIVFSTNKIIGVTVLPLLVTLAFTTGVVYETAIIASIVIILGLFLYRYFLSYISIHSSVRINFFHFLLYFVSFEVLPLILINKVLFILLSKL